MRYGEPVSARAFWLGAFVYVAVCVAALYFASPAFGHCH